MSGSRWLWTLPGAFLGAFVAAGFGFTGLGLGIGATIGAAVAFIITGTILELGIGDPPYTLIAEVLNRLHKKRRRPR